MTNHLAEAGCSNDQPMATLDPDQSIATLRSRWTKPTGTKSNWLNRPVHRTGNGRLSGSQQKKASLQESAKGEAEVSVSLKSKQVQQILGDLQLNRAIRTRENT